MIEVTEPFSTGSGENSGGSLFVNTASVINWMLCSGTALARPGGFEPPNLDVVHFVNNAALYQLSYGRKLLSHEAEPLCDGVYLTSQGWPNANSRWHAILFNNNGAGEGTGPCAFKYFAQPVLIVNGEHNLCATTVTKVIFTVLRD